VYSSFFGFKESPFNLTPDPRYLFLSHYHREALDHLLYGVNERKGFVTITGGIGTGKTTLCRAFLNRLNSSTRSALIFNSFISDSELLETINQEFGIGMNLPEKSKKDYIDALNHFLLGTFSGGGNAVLLLDEAQNLSHEVLEQIRMLSNLETEREKLIQIVLVGQPELREILVTPSLKQLDERITVRYHLKPLDSRDIKAYVAHRLIVAGSRGDLAFTDDAFEKIYAYSKGNPRRINAVCDRALLIAYTKGTRDITSKLIGNAVKDIRGNLKSDTLVSGSSGKKRRSLILLVLMAITVCLAGWNFRQVIFGLFSANQEAAVVKNIMTFPMPPEPKQETPTLVLEGKTSLSTLYDLFAVETNETDYDMNQADLGMVEIDIGPEYYVMFKKPFRVRVAGLSTSSLPLPNYLLVKKTTADGAILIDAAGKERHVMRSFIFDHWGRSVSWIYPSKDLTDSLVEGMSGQDVMKVQMVLNEIGYLVNTNGLYDKSMSREVERFQRDFGLLAHGVVDLRTRALLFQLEAKPDYYRVQKGETLSMVAGRSDVYGDPLKWPSLFRLNMVKLGKLKSIGDIQYAELPQGFELRVVKSDEAIKNLSKAGKEVWVINVLSTQTSKEITFPAVTLVKNGHYAYITKALVKGEDWMRLRVGFFNDRLEAVKAGNAIMSLLNKTDIWVTKLTTDELEEITGNTE